MPLSITFSAQQGFGHGVDPLFWNLVVGEPRLILPSSACIRILPIPFLVMEASWIALTAST